MQTTAYGPHAPDLSPDGHCRTCGFTPDDGRAEHVSDAESALRGTSTPALLRAAYALTHRLHDAKSQGPGGRTARVARRQHIADLWAQRNLITAEILRRTGGA